MARAGAQHGGEVAAERSGNSTSADTRWPQAVGVLWIRGAVGVWRAAHGAGGGVVFSGERR